MDKSVQDSLCYRFSSQGLPQDTVHVLVNTIAKWVNNSGCQWTVDRLKSLHHYFIEYVANEKPIKDFLAEKSIPYFGLRRDGLPKGPFKSIFKIKDMKKALNILSCHADFVNSKLTWEQYEKFLKGISTKTSIDISKLDYYIDMHDIRPFTSRERILKSEGYFSSLKKLSLAFVSDVKHKNCNRYLQFLPCSEEQDHYAKLIETRYKYLSSQLKLSSIKNPPGFEIITTRSIPVNQDGIINYRVKDKADVAVAYAYSWYSVPKLTLDYVGDSINFDVIPDGLLKYEIHDLKYDDGFSLTEQQRMNIVGSIGLIQEKSLKLRAVANPNRITQFYLTPFGDKLYSLLRRIKTDCTFDQDSGARWCQQKLSEGVELSAVDLSAATDTLDVESCIYLIERTFFGATRTDQSMLDETWILARNHFINICKQGKWSLRDPKGNIHYVNYSQGQPMGTYPSFAILGLTNNLVATISAISCGLDPNDSFVVVGDDICMRSSMAKTYIDLITSIGGSVNVHKTVTSSKITEFTGGILSPKRNIRKTVKAFKPDDNSFMSKLKSFGLKAIRFLKPKQQRIAIEKGIYIPGVAVDGPWLEDSYGIPVSMRIDYAFRLSTLMKERDKPDNDKYNKKQFLTYLYWSLQSKDKAELFEYSCPAFFYSDFQSEILLENVAYHCDQIENKVTLLDSLSNVKLPTFSEFVISQVNKTLTNDIVNHLPNYLVPYSDYIRENFIKPNEVVGMDDLKRRLSHVSTIQQNIDTYYKYALDCTTYLPISDLIRDGLRDCSDIYVKEAVRNHGGSLVKQIEELYFQKVFGNVLHKLDEAEYRALCNSILRCSNDILIDNPTDLKPKDQYFILNLGLFLSDRINPSSTRYNYIIRGSTVNVIGNPMHFFKTVFSARQKLLEESGWLLNFKWSKPLHYNVSNSLVRNLNNSSDRAITTHLHM